MPPHDRVSIVIEPGPFSSVVLRREGVAVGVVTAKPRPRPRPRPRPEPPWLPGPLPPPARALRVSLVDEPVGRVLGRSIDDLAVTETATLDVPLAEQASPDMTVVITIHGTNLVDFDDEGLARQLQGAAGAGANVVIRLVE